jgi:hypothetical protein
LRIEVHAHEIIEVGRPERRQPEASSASFGEGIHGQLKRQVCSGTRVVGQELVDYRSGRLSNQRSIQSHAKTNTPNPETIINAQTIMCHLADNLFRLSSSLSIIVARVA